MNLKVGLNLNNKTSFGVLSDGGRQDVARVDVLKVPSANVMTGRPIPKHLSSIRGLSSIDYMDTVDRAAQRLVGEFASAAQNEPREGEYGQRTILKHFQTFLGDIESGEQFKHLRPEDRWEVLRRAISDQIANLKRGV